MYRNKKTQSSAGRRQPFLRHWPVAVTPAPLEALEARQLFSAGSLDTAFSGDGLATATPAGGFAVVALDHRGGRTVVLGQSTNSAAGGVVGGTANLLAYNAAGNLDTTFSGDGVRPLPRVVNPTDVFVQPDGKILVAGTVDGVPGVARLRADGSADATFSGDGFNSLPQLTAATAVRVAADGKIVLAGTATGQAGDTRPAAVRLTAGGLPDSAFGGGDGVAVVEVGSEVTGLAVQPDGKIVLAGSGVVQADRKSDALVLRLTAAGDLDPAFAAGGNFATGGVFAYNDLSLDEYGGGVDLTPDGHVVAGVTFKGVAGLVRLDRDGVLDLDVTDLLTGAVAVSNLARVTVRAAFDGSQFYLVARQLSFGTDPHTRVARFDADGTRDYTFGPGGVIASDGEVVGDLTADGKLVTAGNPIKAAPGVNYAYDPARVQVRRRLVASLAADRVGLAAGSSKTVYVEGTAGKDTVKLATANGVLQVTVNGVTKSFALSTFNRVEVDGNAGDDSVNTTAAVLPNLAYGLYVYAGAGNDTVATGSTYNVVYGGDGNDTLSGGVGSDTLIGGAGDDLLTGGAGRDRLIGDTDLRSLGDLGADRLYGGDGDDVLSGGSVDIRQRGGAIPDFLDGGPGNDFGLFDAVDALAGIESPVAYE
jgi:uncharacterized delta-60 repeat protein